MHFSELAEYSQKCTLGSAPPIRSGQHALVLPISGHRRGTKSPRRTKLNCLPFLGHEKWEAFFMRVDLRVKH
ncbi:hypothetical protein, partial [Collinsella aerofaciens]|uniref:hypothetical protein n=1 Tax=Collinsella aerofaciens TaxID=74426 RepID=UPI00325B0AA6